MHPKVLNRTTIGFLSTWSVYEGTAIDSYTYTLLQGICAAASERNCNLLIGCGISVPGSPRGSRTVWAAPGPGVDFVPIGPWNTDGLLIIPDDFSDSQFEYVQDLIHSGFPVILTTSERPEPFVAVDNAGGIRAAFDHLFEHGHRQIAFIAGKLGHAGDSAERLIAYRSALRDSGIEEDDRLVAYGEHRREDGRIAMQHILDIGAGFTALIASNDLSALGAMDVLRASGLRIPEDVAVIGFDDIPEARSQLPPLTSVRHPTFTLGYHAVLSLLDKIAGKYTGEISARVPTQLVIRQSCGCRLESAPIAPGVSRPSTIKMNKEVLSHLMAERTFIEIRHSPREEIESLCSDLLQGYIESLSSHLLESFDASLRRLIDWLNIHQEDPASWHAAFSVLHRGLPDFPASLTGDDIEFAGKLIDRARLEIVDLAQRQSALTLLQHREVSNRLGLMTSQLLASFDISDSARILAQHLPQLGIQHALIALYSSQEDDTFSHSRVLMGIGLPENTIDQKFPTREFPPSGFYPSDHAIQLAVLPLIIDEHITGFVAFDASNLEPCAAIVHNLASALRTSRLYHDALDGRQLAEEANRLKSRFLSMVSHELRTPLSLIVGLSDMALRAQPQHPGPVMRDIKQISTSAQHLARLISDVLDMASSEAGQLRILSEPLDLVEVMQVTAKIGEEMAHEKGLEWLCDLSVQSPWVLGDRTRLRQVVLNLISNAVKFTPQGQVRLTLSVSTQEAIIAVSDTGIGVSPSEQNSIFQEFHRSERTIQSGYGGLGLGLTISKQLVEQHGGTIGMRSPGDLGSGSTFFFTVPIMSTATAKPDLDSLPVKRRHSVLMLSEGTDEAEQLYTYLLECGFDVDVCHIDQQVEWLSSILASPPAALILGESLAAREGWAIIGMLKQQVSTEHIPVLAYSLDMQHNHGQLLELNYLHKPLRADQLVEELGRYFRKEIGERTVLVVDDDPGILDMHSRLVEQAGCRALIAHNGREALEQLQITHPDLILLDLMMPEMDGFAVLDHLQTSEQTRHIPVIILTARSLSDADLERCNKGVAAILNKGLFNATETLNHIKKALERQYTLGGATRQLVRQAMACIHKRYAESLSREDIAKDVGISADYLTDCFRQELGITPVTYLRRYRIRQSRKLLETTDHSMMQIALAVGFADGAHFARLFQREVGLTPRAYRRKTQQ
ncbi:MAG: substrate-binding domain-containing protein [Anaerolineales bacterium]